MGTYIHCRFSFLMSLSQITCRLNSTCDSSMLKAAGVGLPETASSVTERHRRPVNMCTISAVMVVELPGPDCDQRCADQADLGGLRTKPQL